jgi:hypothetical protein
MYLKYRDFLKVEKESSKACEISLVTDILVNNAGVV